MASLNPDKFSNRPDSWALGIGQKNAFPPKDVISFTMAKRCIVRINFCLVLMMLSCTDSPNTNPLIFYVIGDWGRRGEPNQLVIAYQMNEWVRKQNPKFIMTVGDNFYDTGVADVNDSHWKESFENVYNGNNLIRKPWYVALGNHDYGGNVDAQISYKKINPRWNLPARYYSRVEKLNDGTQVRFMFIDTTPLERNNYLIAGLKDRIASQDTLKQKKWLDSLSALNDVDWKIVVGHHHVYTGGARKNEPSPVRGSLEPIFEKNKVDLYFCGHEHDLQHLKAEGKPTNYFLSGGGSDLRASGTTKESVFSASVQGFMSVSINRTKAEVNIINYRGEIIYTTTITK
jgi:tartrate-resistant acid phosphatase type 5